MPKLFQLAFMFVIACSQSPSLTPADVKQRIEHTPDAVILDVRTHEEALTGIVPEATVIDFNADDFDVHISTLDKSKSYFLYCASGVRSSKAWQRMTNAGFKEVVTMTGGIRAWKEEGLPLENP